MADVVSTTDEERIVRDILQKRPLPETVRSFAVEFGEDFTGDPAVTIWLIVDDNPNPPKRALDRVVRFVRETEDDLLNAGLRHWPYVRFSPASEAER